ncbi:hypothetical protein SO802_005460, partial [Lithocarpus litseifolius]
MVATLTASYFLLTADYGFEPNALDPLFSVWKNKRRVKEQKPCPNSTASPRFEERIISRFGSLLWNSFGIIAALLQ